MPIKNSSTYIVFMILHLFYSANRSPYIFHMTVAPEKFLRIKMMAPSFQNMVQNTWHLAINGLVDIY